MAYHPRRSGDAEVIAAILDFLTSNAPAPRTSIMTAARIGTDLSKRILSDMEDNKQVESYSGIHGNKRCTMYCLFGLRPKPAMALPSFDWAETLSGFRKAVTAAYSAGNDPFKVAA